VGQRLTILRWIMAFLTASTLVHYTHNFVEVDQYPASFIPNWVTQVGVFVTWPVFTAFGIAGYRLYKQGRYRTAHPRGGGGVGVGLVVDPLAGPDAHRPPVAIGSAP
jgi:hypothetical protein